MKKFNLHIEKYGSSLFVRDGRFFIKNKDVQKSIAHTKVRTIIMSKSTVISGMAIKLALDNDIDISFIERGGMPYARVWNSKFGSISVIRRNQLSFSVSKDGNEWIKGVISEKIGNQMALITKLTMKTGKESPYVIQLREKFSKFLVKIATDNTKDAMDLANRLRGWEANASKIYFRAISHILPRKFRFEKRSKRPALDPFNAALNYCYGILYNKIEGFMIRAGLDPHIGIFHKDQYSRPVLVFDVIEMFRHWAEYPVIEAFVNHILLAEHFENWQGKVNLNPIGRKILIELFFAYMNEKVLWKKANRKRITHVRYYIIEFAAKMKNYKPNDNKTSGI